MRIPNLLVLNEFEQSFFSVMQSVRKNRNLKVFLAETFFVFFFGKKRGGKEGKDGKEEKKGKKKENKRKRGEKGKRGEKEKNCDTHLKFIKAKRI